MGAPSSHEVTGLLQAWGRGDEGALQKLVPLVYEQLHVAARRHMVRERAGHPLRGLEVVLAELCLAQLSRQVGQVPKVAVVVLVPPVAVRDAHLVIPQVDHFMQEDGQSRGGTMPND